MCATPSGSGGGGGYLLSAGGSFSTRPPAVTTSCVSSGDKNENIPYQQIPFGLIRLLLRASPPETRAENNIPIYKFPETSIGITSCISFGDESKNLLFPIIHHHPNGCFANGNAANG